MPAFSLADADVAEPSAFPATEWVVVGFVVAEAVFEASRETRRGYMMRALTTCETRQANRPAADAKIVSRVRFSKRAVGMVLTGDYEGSKVPLRGALPEA